MTTYSWQERSTLSSVKVSPARVVNNRVLKVDSNDLYVRLLDDLDIWLVSVKRKESADQNDRQWLSKVF